MLVIRNHAFLKRLPKLFTVQVVEKKNTVKDGTWYLVNILQSHLHILSCVPLRNGQILHVQKEGDLHLKIIHYD